MSLCKSCIYHYRRVFVPLRPEQYEDENGERVFEDQDNIIITNMCLLTKLDLDGEDTVLCNRYEEDGDGSFKGDDKDRDA